MSRRPPRSTRTDTLFPYTTLFRSPVRGDVYHSDENLLTAIPGYRGKSGWQARAIAAVAADMRWPFIGEFAGGTQTLTPRIQVVAPRPIHNLDIPNEDSRNGTGGVQGKVVSISVDAGGSRIINKKKRN